MRPGFLELLDATLDHLKRVRADGTQFVSVDRALLEALVAPAARPAASRPVRPSPAPSAAPSRGAAPTTRPASVFARPLTGPREASLEPVANPGAPSLPPPSLPPPSLEGSAGIGDPIADKSAAMNELRQRALVCERCPHLVRTRTQVVFGVGHLDAELMFVGEAPGAEEDRAGEPFVGVAGQLLTRIITAMGYSRDTVYIANVLKCRPDLPPGTSTGNRAPRPDEMETCKPYLLRQIEIVRPKVLVALGATAVQGLLGLTSPMGSVRGRWQRFQGVPVMPTYHPAYLSRAERGPDRGFREKRKTWEDMMQVLERLGRPITERMRGFFLKPPGG